ncbi:MAG: DUF6236 family protein [Dehalogenimonas sp.]|uniref:Uncharacterized protein n=1 Tax=Candidatus Dehalogenimonas loeffleri TaxID=3127115 RepID=A0ABZ2JAF1_9CHLR|nr:DUF6236 family protein [Dehalogenimonas sp.]
MRSKALYFPYISPPEGNWLYLMLLYWDQLSSIVPFELADSPERLPPHMHILMKEGLIHPVTPAKFIEDIDAFGLPFLSYVERRIRRKTPRQHATHSKTSIHIEKLGHIAEDLVELGAATPAHYPWYEMEPWVANAFMSYLACILGNLPEIDSVPITNDESCLQTLRGGSYGRYSLLDSQRRTVLEDLFPFPKGDVDIPGIIKFKKKYGAELTHFRNEVEELFIDLSAISDCYLREEKRQMAIHKLKNEIECISRRLQETWPGVELLDVLAIMGASGSIVTHLHGDQSLAAGLGAFSLPRLINSYLERRQQRNSLFNHPLAYGALLRRQMSQPNGIVRVPRGR